MGIKRVIISGCAIACMVGPVSAEPAPVIISGKVMMKDGSVPTKSISIEKSCQGQLSGTPGPGVNKKGEYTWRIMIDNLDTANCSLRVNSPDYNSTDVPISSLNGHTATSVTVGPIILFPKVADPLEITVDDGSVPGKSRAAWKASIAAARKDMNAAEAQMKMVVQDSPKFAGGWHGLGVFQTLLGENADARKSMEQAIAVDPKMIQAYVVVERLAIKDQDWAGAVKAADAGIAQDKKSAYPEQYLHLSVAKYQLKDMAAAEAAAHEALSAKNAGKVPRAEYVLGRIMVEKGDTAGGKEHMTKYITSEPDATDRKAIEAYMASMPNGKEPDLEVIQ